jgi:hypothetical protein
MSVDKSTHGYVCHWREDPLHGGGPAGKPAANDARVSDSHHRHTAPSAASEALGGREREWECRTEACAEFGQPVRADEPPTRDERDPGASARERA